MNKNQLNELSELTTNLEAKLAIYEKLNKKTDALKEEYQKTGEINKPEIIKLEVQYREISNDIIEIKSKIEELKKRIDK